MISPLFTRVRMAAFRGGRCTILSTARRLPLSCRRAFIDRAWALFDVIYMPLFNGLFYAFHPRVAVQVLRHRIAG